MRCAVYADTAGKETPESLVRSPRGGDPDRLLLKIAPDPKRDAAEAWIGRFQQRGTIRERDEPE